MTGPRSASAEPAASGPTILVNPETGEEVEPADRAAFPRGLVKLSRSGARDSWKDSDGSVWVGGGGYWSRPVVRRGSPPVPRQL